MAARTTRRGRGPWLAAGAGLIALMGGAWAWRSMTAPGPVDGPIVIFSIDTLRADRLPAYGYAKTRTPNIDRLVGDAMLFETAYAHSPQTLPAHTSILSGLLPFEHGVRDNIGFTVKNDQRSLQHALGDAGFATGGFVSAYVLRRQTGFGQGFDLYDDALPAASPDVPLGLVQRPGASTVAAATAWMDRQSSSRFFLFAHIYEPHKPYSPPERFAAGDPYDGEIEHADEIVGLLLDHLRRTDLYDRSTIILLSDHGEGLGDHGEDEHGIFLYRETIHVPLVVKLPGSRNGGRRVGSPVQQIDLVPTVLDLAGVSPGHEFRGRSLRPVLDGTGTLPAASIYSESLTPRYHFGWSELYALADDRFRLIRAPRDELYDISQDPAERRSIATDRPQVHAAMRRALDAMIAGVAVDTPSAISEEDRRKLAALGYVGTQTGAPLAAAGDELPDPKDRIHVLRKYRHATELASAGQHAEAIGLLRQLLKDDPAMTDVSLQLAGLLERRGLLAEAISTYREVIERDPKSAGGLTGAASTLLRLGRVEEARKHAELAVGVAPAAAHELLARIAVEQGDAGGARREARLTQEADPTLPMSPFVEGLLRHREGDFSGALPHFLEARQALASRTVQMPDVNYLIADTLARLERYPEAEPFFAAELRLFPGNLRARSGLAMLYRAMGRTSESEEAVAELIRAAPTREGYELAAQLWTMFGEPEKAAAARREGRRSPG